MRGCRGFTLLEILLVAALVGLAASVVMLSVGRSGPEQALQTEAERFVALFQLVQEESEMSGDELGLRLEDLENEVQRSQKSESSLKHRLADYQTRLGDKDSEIEKLEGEVRRLKNDLRAAQTLSNNVLSDSQSKNRMLEENISLKQSLTGLSA